MVIQCEKCHLHTKDAIIYDGIPVCQQCLKRMKINLNALFGVNKQ